MSYEEKVGKSTKNPNFSPLKSKHVFSTKKGMNIRGGSLSAQEILPYLRAIQRPSTIFSSHLGFHPTRYDGRTVHIEIFIQIDKIQFQIFFVCSK